MISVGAFKLSCFFSVLLGGMAGRSSTWLWRVYMEGLPKQIFFVSSRKHVSRNVGKGNEERSRYDAFWDRWWDETNWALE